MSTQLHANVIEQIVARWFEAVRVATRDASLAEDANPELLARRIKGLERLLARWVSVAAEYGAASAPARGVLLELVQAQNGHDARITIGPGETAEVDAEYEVPELGRVRVVRKFDHIALALRLPPSEFEE